MSPPQIKIIHNKKLSMTDEEFKAYTNICRSYDRPNFKGDDLFQGLFETDKYGNITIINSPTKQTSFEVFLFVVALYEQQGRRILEAVEMQKLDELSKKFEQRMEEIVLKYEEKLKTITSL